MYKKITLGLLLTSAAYFLSGVEIDTALLNNAEKVRYIEDTAPVSRRYYSTGKQLRNIGRSLAKEILYQEQIQKISDPYADGAPLHKYEAMRVYSSGDTAGADIIYIGNSANVTTTVCLFRIISGYIEKAYGIPTEQADAMAEKVCWWNNNHYDEHSYFTAHFNPKVPAAFSGKTNIIGLAASYKYWRGKTRIVIPFRLVKKISSSTAEPVQPAQKNSPVQTPDNKTEQYDGTGEKEMPVSYKFLFGILIAAAVLLVILLVKAIHGIYKNNQ